MNTASLQQGRIKTWNYGVYAITFLVWVLVLLMRSPTKIPLPATIDLSFIPPLNAMLNTSVCALLIAALVAVKSGNITLHRRLMTSAMGVSAVFLLCYVAYHFTTPVTTFGGEGLTKAVYLFLLATHIVLAAASLPLILKMWVYGHLNEVNRHRRMAKWVYPIWLYVAATGPACYLMLRPYY